MVQVILNKILSLMTLIVLERKGNNMAYESLMSFEQFQEAAKDFFQKKYQGNWNVSICPVLKNNGVYLHGLSVIREDDQVVPTIYLESFYEQYQKGIPFEQVMERVELVNAANTKLNDVSADYYKEYETAKDSLRLKIINYQKNKVFLEEVPFVKFLDLALICYSRFPEPVVPNGAIVVKKNHLAMWEVTEQEVFEQALYNSRQQEKEVFVPILDMMRKLQENEAEDLFSEIKEEPKLYVLTNQNCLFGATVMYYPKVLFQCANQLKSDLYILPSSINELLFLKTEDGEVDQLREMVREVNQDRVLKEEVLSYHVYHYDWNRQILRDLDTGEEIEI